MRSTTLLLLCVAALGLGCATGLPPPAPVPDGSIIVASVNINHQEYKRYAEKVYFVRIKEDESPYSQASLIPSNYQIGDYACLVNAEPGRYAVVATFYSRSGGTSSTGPVGVGGGFSAGVSMSTSGDLTTYFGEDLIEETVFEVGPSTIALVGEVKVDVEGMAGGDSAELHYYGMLATEKRAGFPSGSTPASTTVPTNGSSSGAISHGCGSSSGLESGFLKADGRRPSRPFPTPSRASTGIRMPRL